MDNNLSKHVFLHELGHSFGGLADEYYASEVSYNDFYPKGVEPYEPNITALLDPSNVKWKTFLSPGIAVPTEYGKEEVEALQAELRKALAASREEAARAKEKGLPAAEIKALQDKNTALEKELVEKMTAVRARYKDLADKVGVFEGAGYAAKGLYRPQMDCLMITNTRIEFCVVCRKAIADMIEYFAPTGR